MISFKSMGAVTLVFLGGYLYIKNSTTKPPTQSLYGGKERPAESISTNPPRATRSVANTLAAGDAPTKDPFNNWKDTASFLKARSSRLSMPTQSFENFIIELDTRNSLAGQNTYDMLEKDREQFKTICAQGYAWACSLYTRTMAFTILPNGVRTEFSIDNPPDEEFSAAATYSCVEGLGSCRYAFLNIRGSEQSEQLKEILNFQCDQGLTISCVSLEEEEFGKLDIKTYCKTTKSCMYLFTESIFDIHKNVVQMAARNCRQNSLDSCERVLKLMPIDSPEYQQANEERERICAESTFNRCGDPLE